MFEGKRNSERRVVCWHLSKYVFVHVYIYIYIIRGPKKGINEERNKRRKEEMKKGINEERKKRMKK